MKKSLALTLSMLAALAARADVGPITITPHTFSQDSATQDVTVHYDLSNSGNPAWVCMDVLTDGVSIGTSSLKTFTGDISTVKTNFIAEGVNRTIVWKARADWPHHISTNAIIRLFAYYTNHLANVPGAYMVVDLSDGTNATSYPISYTMTPPNPLTDTTCASNHLWLKRVEAGTFAMGSPENEIGHQTNETLHEVTLTNAFFMGVFPVTSAQYQLVTGLTPANTNLQVEPKILCPVNRVSYNNLRGTTLGSQWPAANTVDATSFFGILRAKTGNLRFDLPTEAQWEYACRAGTTGAWNNGTTSTATATDSQLGGLGWYQSNADWKAHRVGQKTPNAWGLYDFHGNVYEWCLDRYVDDLGADPVTEPVGAESGANRVTRGGSWVSEAQCCRSAYRSKRDEPNYGNDDRGFRLTLVIGQ